MKKLMYVFIVIVLVVSAFVLFFVTKNQKQNCNNLEYLSNLVGIDLHLYEIHEMKTETIKSDDIISTNVFIKITAENDMQINQNFEKVKQCSPGIIDRIKDYGVDVDTISYYGINYKEFIIPKFFHFMGTEYRPYQVWLFSIENSSEKDYTIIYTNIPYEINITQ